MSPALHPLDSANCLDWGIHAAFLRPAESRELCLCVLIGFLGYGTHDGDVETQGRECQLQ